MMISRIALPLMLVLLMVNGCALHQPMSELVIFRDEVRYPDSTYKGGLGLTTGAQTSYQQRLRKDFRSEISPGAEFSDATVSNPHKLGAGIYFANYDTEPKQSFSASVGFAMLGADMTMRVAPQWFVTVSGSAGGGGQVVIQRLVTQPGRFGASVGVDARIMHHWLDNNEVSSATFSLGPDETRNIYAFGVKGLFVYRAGPGPALRDDAIYFINLYAGYAPQIERPVLGVALGLGTFNRRKNRR